MKLKISVVSTPVNKVIQYKCYYLRGNTEQQVGTPKSHWGTSEENRHLAPHDH